MFGLLFHFLFLLKRQLHWHQNFKKKQERKISSISSNGAFSCCRLYSNTNNCLHILVLLLSVLMLFILLDSIQEIHNHCFVIYYHSLFIKRFEEMLFFVWLQLTQEVEKIVYFWKSRIRAIFSFKIILNKYEQKQFLSHDIQVQVAKSTSSTACVFCNYKLKIHCMFLTQFVSIFKKRQVS